MHCGCCKHQHECECTHFAFWHKRVQTKIGMECFWPKCRTKGSELGQKMQNLDLCLHSTSAKTQSACTPTSLCVSVSLCVLDAATNTWTEPVASKCTKLAKTRVVAMARQGLGMSWKSPHCCHAAAFLRCNATVLQRCYNGDTLWWHPGGVAASGWCTLGRWQQRE